VVWVLAKVNFFNFLPIDVSQSLSTNYTNSLRRLVFVLFINNKIKIIVYATPSWVVKNASIKKAMEITKK
jgi:hypothetical protein